MKSIAFFSILFFVSFSVLAQSIDITSSIDSLTARWDAEAQILETYDGMKTYCRSQPKRAKLILLVKEIHHYDSILYKTVSSKYDEHKDKEAEATLKDIKKLEREYTTSGFLKFIHYECSSFNTIEKNFAKSGGKPYEKEKSKMEKELVKYIREVTAQIDIVDEHIHHLKGL